MNQEDKELLLKDLCARLPYRVIIQIKEWVTLDTELKIGHINRLQNDDIIEIKPYLRQMSSMTEEEWEELNSIGYIVPLYDGCFGVDMRAYCKNGQPHYRRFSEFSIIEDWFNAHHFDYRGLIEKGLAIAVTKDNNHYKK